MPILSAEWKVLSAEWGRGWGDGGMGRWGEGVLSREKRVQS
uniref:Uncharacterized protein n=1 Tax=Desertifilum tharense IPPAS B-1220 TaxID=1781255 RepID=A0ACD5GXY3_9CYAN